MQASTFLLLVGDGKASPSPYLASFSKIPVARSLLERRAKRRRTCRRRSETKLLWRVKGKPRAADCSSPQAKMKCIYRNLCSDELAPRGCIWSHWAKTRKRRLHVQDRMLSLLVRQSELQAPTQLCSSVTAMGGIAPQKRTPLPILSQNGIKVWS